MATATSVLDAKLSRSPGKLGWWLGSYPGDLEIFSDCRFLLPRFDPIRNVKSNLYDARASAVSCPKTPAGRGRTPVATRIEVTLYGDKAHRFLPRKRLVY